MTMNPPRLIDRIELLCIYQLCTWHLSWVCIAPRYCLTNLPEPTSQSFTVESFPQERTNLEIRQLNHYMSTRSKLIKNFRKVSQVGLDGHQ